jgi:hypothetical protein
MSWKSGGSLADRIWSEIKDNIIPEKLQATALAIVTAFEDRDCDVLQGSEMWNVAYPPPKEPCPDCGGRMFNGGSYGIDCENECTYQRKHPKK